MTLDEAMHEIMGVLIELASGNLDARVNVSEDDGELAAIMTGLNMLAEELQRRELEREFLQVRLVHADRLASIGQLAAGVAHEIKNPAQGILGYSELIQMEKEASETTLDFSREIEQEIQRINSIVENLLSLAREETPTPAECALHEIVGASLLLSQSLLRAHKISLEVDVPENLPEFECRPQQIRQVLMNLIANARDALNQRYPEANRNKVIGIRGRQITQDHARFVRLTVEDRAGAINPDALDMIFEPFYTTKSGDGTGLGLSISHDIVREHGGRLWAEVEPGEWTRFHVDLPA